MKKKLKLNKKTIAELSNSEKVVGGGASDLICAVSQKPGCISKIICVYTEQPGCINTIKDGACLSDVECNSRDTRCDDTVIICMR